MSDRPDLFADVVWDWLGRPATLPEALDAFFTKVVVPRDPARYPPPGTPVEVRDFLHRRDVAPVDSHVLGDDGVARLRVRRAGTGPEALTLDPTLVSARTWRPMAGPACWRRLTEATEELVVASDADEAAWLAATDAAARRSKDPADPQGVPPFPAPFVRVPDDESLPVWRMDAPPAGSCECIIWARDAMYALPPNDHHPRCEIGRPVRTAGDWAVGRRGVLYRGPRWVEPARAVRP